MSLLALARQAATASDDASGRLSMVIIALVVLAVLITVVTVVFWRLTRPEPEPAMRWSSPEPDGSADSSASAEVGTPPGPRTEQPRSAG